MSYPHAPAREPTTRRPPPRSWVIPLFVVLASTLVLFACQIVHYTDLLG